MKPGQLNVLGYYKCTRVNNHGKQNCGTRQIAAERLHEAVYNNLLRVSFDETYIKNLVFSLQNQLPHPGGVRFELSQDVYSLTPEIVQKTLKAFVNACARKTGIEKALMVRKWIQRVRYSKKSIGVDFVVDVPSSENGGKLTASVVESGPSGPVGRGGGCAAPHRKDSNRLSQLEPLSISNREKMARFLKIGETLPCSSFQTRPILIGKTIDRQGNITSDLLN